jgi:hypothetical protein
MDEEKIVLGEKQMAAIAWQKAHELIDRRDKKGYLPALDRQMLASWIVQLNNYFKNAA